MKAAKDRIDVDAGETRRVPDMLLRQRQMHFLHTMAWPLHAIPNEKLKQYTCDMFTCRATSDAGQMIVREVAFAPDDQKRGRLGVWAFLFPSCDADAPCRGMTSKR